MILSYGTIFLIIDKTTGNKSYNSSLDSILTFFILNGMNKFEEGIVQHIYSNWFDRSNKLANENPQAKIKDSLNYLIKIMNDFVEKNVLIVIPSYIFRIDLVSFSDDEFALDEFMRGHIIIEDENKYLFQYLKSKIASKQFENPEEIMKTLIEFSDNRFLGIDFEKVFHDKLN